MNKCVTINNFFFQYLPYRFRGASVVVFGAFVVFGASVARNLKKISFYKICLLLLMLHLMISMILTTIQLISLVLILNSLQ